MAGVGCVTINTTSLHTALFLCELILNLVKFVFQLIISEEQKGRLNIYIVTFVHLQLVWEFQAGKLDFDM